MREAEHAFGDDVFQNLIGAARDPKTRREHVALVEGAFERGEFAGRGEVPTGSWLIDGDATDPVDKVVVRDRRHLSNDGVVVPIVVINRQEGRMESEPEIISRGYPTLEGATGTVEEVKRDLVALVRSLSVQEIRDSSILKAKVKSAVKRTLKRNEARIPLIIPVVMEI